MYRLLCVSLVSLLVCLPNGSALAKRSPPAEVAPVRQGDVEYRVRHSSGGGYLPGFVEARDIAKNQRLWLRQIYVIRRNPDLEQDVQDVFITSVKRIVDRNVLEIRHEPGGLFELDLDTLEVKVVQGQAVIPAK